MEDDDSMSNAGIPFYYQFRIILIGDSTVGKSSLLKYFSDGRFAEISDPTVGVDFYTRIVTLENGLRIKLQLWDTAGQEKFKSITRSYYRNSVGVIIAYDIQQRQSFENVEKWLVEAQDNVGGPFPGNCVFQLVGHKSDLHSQREVMYEEGSCFAKYHDMKFIETSACTGENVEECFLMITREIYKRFEKGELQLTDGWDGIKSAQLIGYDAISLCEDDEEFYNKSCAC
uniref:Ras-related protein Rab-14 (inferred by orthology to a human protein) n=1 Tax=Strongyloides venezuelensis TaxID=75913 RepID=A0A0K0FE09_STRVS